MIISCSATYFLEVGTRILLKVVTKGLFRGKKSKNLAFLTYFSEANTDCDQKD